MSGRGRQWPRPIQSWHAMSGHHTVTAADSARAAKPRTHRIALSTRRRCRYRVDIESNEAEDAPHRAVHASARGTGQRRGARDHNYFFFGPIPWRPARRRGSAAGPRGWVAVERVWRAWRLPWHHFSHRTGVLIVMAPCYLSCQCVDCNGTILVIVPVC